MGMRPAKIAARLVPLLLVGLCPSLYRGQAAEPGPLPFAPGETLTYDMSWGVFPAGQIVATVSSAANGQQDDYQVEATATSRGFVSLLYPVNDEFRSTFDPRTLCSQRIDKRMSEGRRRLDTHIVFDSERKLAVLNEHDLVRMGVPAKHAEMEIPACVEDVVAAFYDVRRLPLRVGEKFNLSINDGSKTSEVLVDVQARESVSTPLGARPAFRVEPTVFGGLFKRKGRMLIWFSDDAQRLPLRIKAMITVGTLTATLRSATQGASD
ncbi:MAG: DUF3108 domain-containing protein [Terriglobia bacterium]